jgi:hypothetical protein
MWVAYEGHSSGCKGTSTCLQLSYDAPSNHLPLGSPASPGYTGYREPCLQASPKRPTSGPASSWMRWRLPVCSAWNGNSSQSCVVAARRAGGLPTQVSGQYRAAPRRKKLTVSCLLEKSESLGHSSSAGRLAEKLPV